MPLIPANPHDQAVEQTLREIKDSHVEERNEALKSAEDSAAHIAEFIGTDNAEASRLAASVIVELRRVDRLQACIDNYYNAER